MSWYKLVPSTRPESRWDEVKFRTEDGGDKTASIHYPVELSESDVQILNDLGYQVREDVEPEVKVSDNQVASDVAGMSPVVDESGELDQIETENVQTGESVVSRNTFAENKTDKGGE